jgi:hypothetical protein
VFRKFAKAQILTQFNAKSAPSILFIKIDAASPMQQKQGSALAPDLRFIISGSICGIAGKKYCFHTALSCNVGHRQRDENIF